MVKCRLCKKSFKLITSTHLRNYHHSTIKEYKKKFNHENIGFLFYPNKLPKKDPKYLAWKKSLLKRPKPWNTNKTKDNDARLKHLSDTFISRKIDNFCIWREKAKKEGLIPDTDKQLAKDKNLAFLTGLILGDGHIEKLPRTEGLRVTLGTDKTKLWIYTANIMRMVFNKNPNIRKRPTANCMDLRIYQKNLSRRLDIPCGARRDITINIPKWILDNSDYTISLLKGLFEAEGSFSIHKPTCTYNFSFDNRNVSLLDCVEKTLIKLGFHPERRPYAVRLRKKYEALRFEKLISFRSYS